MRCHVVQGQPVQQEGPNIKRLDPALQQQWDHAANAHLGNIDIKPHMNIKVWWSCGHCPDGHPHSWEATIYNRTAGTGCPQCSGRKVCKHNSLATKAPSVAAQWDFEANDGTPESIVAQSSQPVGWLCELCGHKWTAKPGNRISRKAGCPQCANAKRQNHKIKHPTFAECQDPRGRALLAEWDHERNAQLQQFPHNVRLKSLKQIFWLCTECPAGEEHSWSARPGDRMKSIRPGCPFCAGKSACKCNSLEALYPEVAAEWDDSKNKGQPSDYTARSHKMAWWLTPEQGSWQQTINARTDQRLVRHR